MSLEHRKSAGLTELSLSLPATIMAGALLVALVAALLAHVAENLLVPFRVVLLVGALIAAGLAVWWQLCSPSDEFEQRIWGAILVATGAGVIFCCREAMDEAWDSLRMALAVFTAVALVGAVLVLLPRVGRRIVVSLLLLFHFGGILTATTAVAPHNGQPAPWLPTFLWTMVYRPYLQFAYLNNAYHFYSPEPGPPTWVWFRVEFEDKSVYWYKLVDRDQFPTRVQYQRMLALTESTNQPWAGVPNNFSDLYAQRKVAGDRLGIRTPEPYEATNYYRLQSPQTKKYLPSYVRHVARFVREEHHLNVPVKRVQVYRIALTIISAKQLVHNWDPLDRCFYQAWFLGVFKPNGEAVPDPFTNWLLPITRTPKVYPFDFSRWEEDTVLVDDLEKHIESLERQSKRQN